MRLIIGLFSILLFLSCQPAERTSIDKPIQKEKSKSPFIVVLGTIQDAGSPHIACKKDCCKDLFGNPDINRQVVSLGLVDNSNNKSYLFEATPDISTQLKALRNHTNTPEKEMADAIFLTHAHIGHYAGLMYLGKEATDAKEIDVYAMPKMKNFLSSNGPWDQLVNRKNITINEMKTEKSISLSKELSVTPYTVPHRDEYSETVGFTIKGPNKSALFIPDIDKWEKWEKDIIQEIKKVDYAFLDATFYDGEEINNRDITQIPHPFVIESLESFKNLSADEKAKIHFIHFNHTNPIINYSSQQAKNVLDKGFNIARINQVHEL